MRGVPIGQYIASMGRGGVLELELELRVGSYRG